MDAQCAESGHAATEPKSNARVERKKQTKSRGGCLRCKEKRRKCSENKPECDECIRRNLPCPGYKKELKWSPWQTTKHGKRHVAAVEGQSQSKPEDTSPDPGTHVPRKESAGSSDHFSPGEIIDEEALRQYLLSAQDATFHFNLSGSSPSPSFFPNEDSQRQTLQVGVDTTSHANLYNAVSCLVFDEASMQPEWIVPSPAQDVEEEVTLHDNQVISSQITRIPERGQQPPILNRSLVDVTTFLIDYWFREVCPLWSAFDSSLNPNRVLVSRMWTHSKAVLHCLKLMSATCLLQTLPHLESEASSAARTAVESIEEDLSRLSLDGSVSDRTHVPLDLFLALLCIGTTMCWLDTTKLGLSFWKEARRLLSYYNSHQWLLNEEEKQKLAFFDNSCVYWDLLCSVVSDEGFDVMADSDVTMEQPGCQLPLHLIQPHPWTGVAYRQQRLLARSIALCRRYRLRVRAHRNTMTNSEGLQQATADDLLEAYIISNDLAAIEAPSEQSILDMGDKLAPHSHFAQLADAFRVASLLQLHQTFPMDTSIPVNPVAQRQTVLKLAFELVQILEDIPVWSTTRCTQPILYITAASGLRFVTSPSESIFSALTPEVLEVHRARKFILDRFASLQRSLPPRPVVVATDLVQAIWQAYEKQGIGEDVHWIDVMIDSKLSTLFG